MKDTTLPPDGFAPTRTPFGKALADEEPFKYDQFDEIAGLLKRAVKEKAIAMVTGQAGMGKTTAIRTFVRTGCGSFGTTKKHHLEGLFETGERSVPTILCTYRVRTGIGLRMTRRARPVIHKEAFISNTGEGASGTIYGIK